MLRRHMAAVPMARLCGLWAALACGAAAAADRHRDHTGEYNPHDGIESAVQACAEDAELEALTVPPYPFADDTAERHTTSCAWMAFAKRAGRAAPSLTTWAFRPTAWPPLAT